MRVTFLLLSVERSGGVRVTSEIVNQLSDIGHECIIVVPVQNEFPFKLRKSVKIIRVNKNRGKEKFGIIRSVIDLAFAIPTNTDMIVSSYYLTAYSAILAKLYIPQSQLFYIVQGFEPNYFKHENGRTQWFSYLLARLSYRLPLKRSVISNWLANLICANGYKRVPVINNGIDSELFRPITNNSDLLGKVIMTIANKRPNRGFFDFCKAVNLLWETRKDFSVLIIGTDSSVIQGLNVPFQFITPLNDYELIDAYQKSTIYVSCSHEEGFGLTPLEAMSCGTPVVCTDSGGVRDYAVDGVNCLMVLPKKIDHISSALNKLLLDKNLRRVFKRNGRETALKFDWKVIGKQYDIFFQENKLSNPNQ
jgi:glycosyltransferase involved in cell wall biosynthesis